MVGAWPPAETDPSEDSRGGRFGRRAHFRPSREMTCPERGDFSRSAGTSETITNRRDVETPSRTTSVGVVRGACPGFGTHPSGRSGRSSGAALFCEAAGRRRPSSSRRSGQAAPAPVPAAVRLDAGPNHSQRPARRRAAARRPRQGCASGQAGGREASE
jgi:hypothetical protein